MRRAVWTVIGPLCGLVLLLVVYRTVLFGGEQFAFRDAAHYYYPLYLRVQQEWQAGRWPLWDPWQNGGQPLLGDPTAAVFYPGKVVYAVLPYAWAARLYVVGHTVIAFTGLLALARSLGISTTGAAIGALSYAFGAPVLFQYCNVIYLVGAAWLPWGLRAVDRLLRGRSGPTGLVVVLTMQLLGGDPQAAYLTIAAGACYAIFLTCKLDARIARWAREIAVGLLAAWVIGSLGYAWRRTPVPGWANSVWLPALAAWAGLGAWLGGGWWRSRPRAGALTAGLGTLAMAGTLALAVSAVQVLPVAEFLGQGSLRAEQVPTLFMKFSVEPYRLVEALWPWPFGHPYPEYRSWIQAIPPRDDRMLWEPSLYFGGLTLVLAVSAMGFRGGPPWRAWLTTVTVIAVLASFGKFASPIWMGRCAPTLASLVGPHDPANLPARTDAHVMDGAGSPYTLLSAVLPGFGMFRFPAKLLTLAAAAVAVLAGYGWDELAAGRSRRCIRVCVPFLAITAVALLLALAVQRPVVSALERCELVQVDVGLADVRAAWGETVRALGHGLVLYFAIFVLATCGPRRPRLAGALALVILTLDLGMSAGGMIWTVPQAAFEVKPEAARRIAAAEREQPSDGPFRVYRMPSWYPRRFLQGGSPERLRALIDWTRETLTPLSGLPLGLESSATSGAIGLDDYESMFMPMKLTVGDELARSLKIAPGRPLYYHPRRAFDLWGTRYFILPIRNSGWATAERAFASFLSDVEVVYPKPEDLGGTSGLKEWTDREDWQLLRNKAAFPRAWIVHQTSRRPPVADTEDRDRLVRELNYPGDRFWSEPGWVVNDLHALAWIESAEAVRPPWYFLPMLVDRESVAVTHNDPVRVELRARLTESGFVVLADTFYPGWRLTIDGRPAPIYRTNRMMRGAAVPPGDHVLIYEYSPWSFRIGLMISTVGLAAVAGVGLAARRRTAAPGPGPDAQ